MLAVLFVAPGVSSALPMPPFTTVGAIKETPPVGMTVPEVGVTVKFAVTGIPWVKLLHGPQLRVRFVIAVFSPPAAVFHAVARFVTLTEPRPVAMS